MLPILEKKEEIEKYYSYSTEILFRESVLYENLDRANVCGRRRECNVRLEKFLPHKFVKDIKTVQYLTNWKLAENSLNESIASFVTKKKIINWFYEKGFIYNFLDNSIFLIAPYIKLIVELERRNKVTRRVIIFYSISFMIPQE